MLAPVMRHVGKEDTFGHLSPHGTSTDMLDRLAFSGLGEGPASRRPSGESVGRRNSGDSLNGTGDRKRGSGRRGSHDLVPSIQSLTGHEMVPLDDWQYPHEDFPSDTNI